MKKIAIILILISFNLCSSQTDIYTRIFQSADSLKIKNKVGILENDVYEVANKLSESHPMKYYETSAEYLKKGKYNEASFLYYLGRFRYKYYNSSNPDYKKSGDGALAGAMSSMLGEPIITYLKCNIENYISIINLTIQYNRSNDYIFYPKEKDNEKFNLEEKKFVELVNEMENNKTKYAKEWKKERKELENLFKE